MLPRAVRRPSAVTAPLKKRPLHKAEHTTTSTTISNHQPYSTLREEKEDEEFAADRSNRLQLEYNDPYVDVEEDGWENTGIEDHWEMGRVEEEGGGGEDRFDGEYMMEGEEELSQGDYRDEQEMELDGFEEEQHGVVKERRKRKEFEVFVGGLDRDASEEDLRKVFSRVGDITEVRLMKNPLTKKNKGFAFIRFATVEQSRRAVNELKHPVVNGKQCGVAPSQDSDTLFVGNICKTWTKEVIKEKLFHYGVEKFEELTLVEDTKNEGMNRGFAFLDFPSRADALEACKRLQKRDVVFGTDRTARVAFADTFIEPDDEIMSQVRTVFIDGLPSTWDEDRVREHVKKFGRIVKVELARNMPAAKRNDFGFITFDTHDDAVACVDGINDSEIAYGYKKVKVRARLSRPRQRGKSARHARGGYLVGHGGDRDVKDSWGSSMPRMDTWKFTGRSGRSITSPSAYDGRLKRSLELRDRSPLGNLVANRTGRRRQILSPDRSFKRRNPVSAYGQSSLKRDYMRQDDSFDRSLDFAGPSVERHLYRDAYLSRGSGYLEDSSRSVSRVTTRRISISPLYEDERYGYMEHSSSYIRDYGSNSGLKRPHSAIEEAHPHYADSSRRQPRARFDYRSSSGLPYSDSSYGSDSTRMGRGSRSGYDGGSQSSAGHSHGHGLYDRSTSGMGYRSDEVSREDVEEMYSRYGRDHESREYIPSRSDLGAGSYPSVYSSRHMNDGYFRGRDSDSYY